MPKDEILTTTNMQSDWRSLLWFLTVRWRWPVSQQREFLSWWQSLGWKEGWNKLNNWKEPVHNWQELKSWLLQTQVLGVTDRWPWITLVDPEFPDSLRFCDAAPTVLWSNHAWEKWSGPVLTVVGSRRATAYGRLAVQQLIPSLVQQWNVLVVSGGAFGIDQAAHDAVLQMNKPTWVVLGCGLDHVSPSLAKYQKSPARLVSPFPPEDHAEKWRFPARNRVMAQLSQAVLVVEAAEKSGSLITAGAALEYGKDVLVVLPPFTSPNAAGAVRLLQKGAIPVAQFLDIAQAMGCESEGEKRTKLIVRRTPEEDCVLQYLLTNGGTARLGGVVEAVCQSRGLEKSVVQGIITTLELRGWITIELGRIQLSGMIQS